MHRKAKVEVWSWLGVLDRRHHMQETFMTLQEADRLKSSVCLLPAPRCLWRAFKPKMPWHCRAGKKTGKMEPSCLLLEWLFLL